MGTEKSTDFHFLVIGFLFKSAFWVLGLLCNSLFFVFGAVAGRFYRVEESEKIEPSSGLDSGGDGFGKIETLDMDFVFRGDSGGAPDESEAEREGSVFSEHAATTMTSKYQFVSGKNISGFVEEPRIMSLTVQEMFVGPADPAGGMARVPEKQFSGKSSFETEDSVLSFSFGMAPEKVEKVRVADFKNDESGKLDFSGEARFDSDNDVLPEPDSTGSDFDLGSSQTVTEDSVFEIEDEIDDFENDESGKLDFSGEAQFDSKYDFLPEPDSIITEHDLGSCENVAEDFGFEIDLDPIVAGDGSDDNMEEVSDPIVAGDGSGEDSGEEIDDEAVIGSGKVEGQGCFDDSEDDVGWDLISEHQDLIEQLKIELKNVRIGGLPTILEESESPKIVEDLKPLKINEKRLEHKDRVEEIHKVYKNYAEKMKKLDVLNYQTVHAIGFIRRKDQSQFIPIRKPNAMKLPFLKNKPRSIRDDPIGDLERDLELVYVGQACLSWKILYWQYEKAKDLSDHDPQGFRHYNEVAGEFQLFQVLVQRYVEDETFQGPRLHNYVKNRCIIRNLLQVPVIKDDKDKKGHKGDESAIPISMLKQIIHQCMHVFWAFLRADKKGTNMIGSQLFQAELQNPSDKTLYMEVQTNLQKKEKKLKDITRTGNCIVKKFQKQNQEARLHHELFIAQVELRLVSRVLNMSRLSTQQLVWCHEQLGKVNFVGRRVCLEPSFLLFPC